MLLFQPPISKIHLARLPDYMEKDQLVTGDLDRFCPLVSFKGKWERMVRIPKKNRWTLEDPNGVTIGQLVEAIQEKYVSDDEVFFPSFGVPTAGAGNK